MPLIDRLLRPQIDALLSCPFTGSCFRKLVLTDPETSCPAVFCEQEKIDHFKLLIPYAGHVLTWEIRFDNSCLEFAPDFLFDDESFLSYLDVDVLSERVPSLSSWNIGRPECLSEVVQQLLNLYTEYQMQRLERDGSPLGGECSKFMQQFELEPFQLQVLSGDSPVSSNYFSGSTRPSHNTVTVMFLHLERQVTCSQIPEKYMQMALQFSFREYSPTTVMFHVNPALRHLLGEQEELEVSNYSKSEGLSKYFYHFLGVVKETFCEITQNYEKREEFHFGVYYELSSCENVKVTPLENNIPQFTVSSYIVETQNYPVTVIIQTPSNRCGDSKVSVRTLNGRVHDIHIAPAWDHQKIAETIIQTLLHFREENMDFVEL